MSHQMTLVLGGARSGKSSWAQQQAEQYSSVLYVATAEAIDEDMADRIRRHQKERPPHWHTLEAPLQVAIAVREWLPRNPAPDCIVVDCITVLANHILEATAKQDWESVSAEDFDAALQLEVQALVRVLQQTEKPCYIVSNELGLGIIPADRVSRLYRDGLGRANQWLAAECDAVSMMVAGLPVRIKP